MTVLQWLGVLAYVTLATSLGGLCIRWFRFAPDALIHNWASRYLCGQILLAILTLTTGLLPWNLGTVLLVAVGLAAAGSVWALRRGLPAGWPRRTGVELGFALATLLVFANLVFVVQFTPVAEWDARSIWMFHGKAIYYSGGVAAEYFANPLYWWSNLDYPLQIPAQNALNAQILGEWTSITTRAFLLCNFVAYCRLLFLLLRQRGQPIWLAAGIIVLVVSQQVPAQTYAQMYVSGQADVHYALPFWLAMVSLTATPERRSAPFVVLMLSLVAGTKSEGAAYVTLLGVAALGLWAAPRLRRRNWGALRQLVRGRARLLGFAVLLGAVPMLLWSLFKSLHGITGGLHLLERITTKGVLLTCLQERTGMVLSSLRDWAIWDGTHYVLLAWVVLVLSTIVARRLGGVDCRRRRCEWFTVLGILGMVMLMFTTYLLTPHDVKFHMDTSAARLLLLPHQLVLLLCLLRLDLLVQIAWPGVQPMVAGSEAPPAVGGGT